MGESKNIHDTIKAANEAADSLCKSVTAMGEDIRQQMEKVDLKVEEITEPLKPENLNRQMRLIINEQKRFSPE